MVRMGRAGRALAVKRTRTNGRETNPHPQRAGPRGGPRPAMAAQAAEAGLRSHRYACTNASRSALRTSALTVSIPCE